MKLTTKNSPSEQIECEVFWNWLTMNGLAESSAHIPNEIYTPFKGTLGKLKRIGFSKGLPDYIIFIPPGLCKLDRPYLLFIEMKRQGATESSVKPEQWKWIGHLNSIVQVRAEVCHGADDATDFVATYLKKPIMFN